MRLGSPVTVDGHLDDAAWQRPATLPIAFEVSPAENVPAPARTEVWIAFDERALYFAFRAHDPEPGEIRARFVDRDTADDQDFVGVILDTFDDAQRGYELFVNPLGVQMDLVLDDVAGSEDGSWDTLWRSAGRLTGDGYEVEIELPFSSLRFPRGEAPMTWGLDAVRVRPRASRALYAASPRQRGRNCSLCQFAKLEGVRVPPARRDVELVPTLTGDRTDRREPEADGGWHDGETGVEPGLTARWGITPDWTAVATLNPDFSQVEADVEQLAVNEQFALFYPEKRPFFLEGADLFATQLGVVYTRNVADPDWGGKLVGKQAGNAFGVVVASDALTNILLPGREGSELVTVAGPSTAGIARWRRNLGRDSSVGLLATGRRGERGYSNGLAGFDALLRFGESLALRFEGFGSETRDPAELAGAAGVDPTSGWAVRTALDYSTRDWFFESGVTGSSDGFRADLGFVPQVGVWAGYLRGGRNWYGDGRSGLDRWTLASTYYRTEDQDGAVLRDEIQLWGFANGPGQSHLFLELDHGTRSYQGREFGADAFRFELETRPLDWLRGEMEGMTGDGIDYAGGRPGDLVQLEAEIGVALGRHLDLAVGGEAERLEVTGGTLYTATVTRLKATYQIDLRTFVRWISQRLVVDQDPALALEPIEAHSSTWGNQLLFSFKLNPQTVLYLGYSDGWDDDLQRNLVRTTRTGFIKLGYAWQI